MAEAKIMVSQIEHLVDRYVKPHLQLYLRIWDAERRQDFKVMEEHVYTCIYDIQKHYTSPDKKLAALNQYRAKLVRLQARRMEYLRIDISERDMIEGEETTLYQFIKFKKRCEARRIRRTQDQRGRITEDPTQNAQIFVAHFKDKYNSIEVSDSCVAEMLNAIRPNTQPSYAAYLEQPITAEELYAALISGGPNKAPGSDGISRELYIRLWHTMREGMLGVMNQMYIHKSMTRHQQHGIIVSLPKDKGDITFAGYHPITLMNTNYKLLARIMARRLTPVLENS
jgi:hypothetical protein